MERKNRNKGFTLVELLITVVILAIIVAPFLGAFVMASGNNLNASEKQDAANLAEDIAEEIKGKTLDAIIADPNYSSSTDPATGKVIHKIDIPSGSSALPVGIRNGFSATATLKPATHDINNDMPTLTNINGGNTLLLMSGFYSNDNTPGAVRRKSTITIQFAPPNYHVELEVEYFDVSGISLGADIVSEADYTEVPAIFAVYASMNPNDELYFINELDDDDMENADGDIVPVKFFLSIQEASGASTIYNSNIRIQDVGMGMSPVGIESYIQNQMTNDTNRTNVYANASFPSSVTYKGEAYKNSLVEDMQSDKLYDLTVEVEYNGKNYKFVSSKLNLG